MLLFPNVEHGKNERKRIETRENIKLGKAGKYKNATRNIDIAIRHAARINRHAIFPVAPIKTVVEKKTVIILEWLLIVVCRIGKSLLSAG